MEGREHPVDDNVSDGSGVCNSERRRWYHVSLVTGGGSLRLAEQRMKACKKIFLVSANIIIVLCLVWLKKQEQSEKRTLSW